MKFLPNQLEQAIDNRFGSKRGLLQLSLYRLQWWLGIWRSARDVDFTKVNRLIFVCSGNICRSPFGEYYAKALGLEAASFGLHTRGGDGADPRALDFATRQGVDMRGHRTSNISSYTPQPGDLLLVMEPGQYQELSVLAQSHSWPESIQCAILPLYRKTPVPYLHDPFSASPEFFDYCEHQVMEAVDGIALRLQSLTPTASSRVTREIP